MKTTPEKSVGSQKAAQQASTIQAEQGGMGFAREVARLAADMRCEDVVVLDLRGLSSFTDFFVIATGTSDRQMRAVLDRLEQQSRALGRRPMNVAGRTDRTWMVADYVDVVVHVFDDEHRKYYDLDGYWGDAPRVAWQIEAEMPKP